MAAPSPHRRGRVVEKLDRRRGACTRCGACCKILFQCPAYDDADGNPKCLIYNDRPGVCSLFPLDEKDLRDRDIVMSGRRCGFYFEDGPRPEGERRESMPLRWGPAREDGEVRVGASLVAMVKFLAQKPTPDGHESGKS